MYVVQCIPGQSEQGVLEKEDGWMIPFHGVQLHVFWNRTLFTSVIGMSYRGGIAPGGPCVALNLEYSSKNGKKMKNC